VVIVSLHALSACSLVDAFTGAETPFSTIERVRPNGRSIFTLAARGTTIAASGGPDVTFIERRGSNNYFFGNQFSIPQPAAMAIGNFNDMPSEEVVALNGAGIDVVTQDGQTATCPITGGSRVVTGDLDGDGPDDIAILHGQDVTVFFGVSGTGPGLDCAASQVVPLGRDASSLAFAPSVNGARLYVLGQSEVIVLAPFGDPKRMFDLSTLPSASVGGSTGHIAAGDVDGDGELDLLYTGFEGGGDQLTIQPAVERFEIGEAIGVALASPTGLVTFRNGDSADGIAIARMNPGGIDIAFAGDDFEVSEIGGAYNSEVTQLFAADLDGDQIEDLISDGENTGDIVIALSSGS